MEVSERGPQKATYKLTTTVMLSMGVAREEVGSTNLSGSLTRQVRGDCVICGYVYILVSCMR